MDICESVINLLIYLSTSTQNTVNPHIKAGNLITAKSHSIAVVEVEDTLTDKCSFKESNQQTIDGISDLPICPVVLRYDKYRARLLFAPSLTLQVRQK